MNLNKIIPVLFSTSIIIVIIGMLFKIQHWNNAGALLIVGLLSQVVLAFLCLYEIANSNKFTKLELLVWLIGFILLTIPTCLIYMLTTRKRMNTM